MNQGKKIQMKFKFLLALAENATTKQNGSPGSEISAWKKRMKAKMMFVRFIYKYFMLSPYLMLLGGTILTGISASMNLLGTPSFEE